MGGAESNLNKNENEKKTKAKAKNEEERSGKNDGGGVTMVFVEVGHEDAPRPPVSQAVARQRRRTAVVHPLQPTQERVPKRSCGRRHRLLPVSCISHCQHSSVNAWERGGEGSGTLVGSTTPPGCACEGPP